MFIYHDLHYPFAIASQVSKISLIFYLLPWSSFAFDPSSSPSVGAPSTPPHQCSSTPSQSVPPHSRAIRFHSISRSSRHAFFASVMERSAQPETLTTTKSTQPTGHVHISLVTYCPVTLVTWPKVKPKNNNLKKNAIIFFSV